MNKYEGRRFVAFYPFMHNYTMVESGQVFNAEELGFTNADLEFLLSTDKIYMEPINTPINIPVQKVNETVEETKNEEVKEVEVKEVEVKKVEEPAQKKSTSRTKK